MTRAEYEQRTKQIIAEYDGKARYLRLSVLDESYISSLERQVRNLSTQLALADEQIKLKDELLEQYRLCTDRLKEWMETLKKSHAIAVDTIRQLESDNLQLMKQIEGKK